MITATAFGPFGNFRLNPSEVLGRAVFGDGIHVLPVSFAAVDRFLDELPTSTENLLMLGVAGTAKSIRIEREAHDRIGSTADVEGNCPRREQSTRLNGRLFKNIGQADWCDESIDAGDYLCNYIYYEACRRHPNVQAGFIHVPPFSALPFPIQLVRLRRLINLIQ